MTNLLDILINIKKVMELYFTLKRKGTERERERDREREREREETTVKIRE
jgi:hypothetical protein